MAEILVTSFKNPDLDGTACIYAYSEFLQKEGIDAIGGSYENPRKEARFVLDTLSIELGKAKDTKEIILVDASDPVNGISKEMDINKVVEIIDHRKNHHLDEFCNVKKHQIELVGACATLIVEKFYEKKIELSKNSAILLYSAIIWNTINLRNNVTTARDVKMATWLLTQINLPRDYVYNMFAYGQEECLKELYFVNLEFKDKKVGVAQIETVEIDEFISKNEKEIFEILNSNKNKFDYIFITCIDLENGFNRFIANDEKTKTLIETLFKVEFQDNIAKREGIIMRKEIIPILKEYLFR
jgi:inorganic pyrophosphatase/exopolyphosphatase